MNSESSISAKRGRGKQAQAAEVGQCTIPYVTNLQCMVIETETIEFKIVI